MANTFKFKGLYLVVVPKVLSSHWEEPVTVDLRMTGPFCDSRLLHYNTSNHSTSRLLHTYHIDCKQIHFALLVTFRQFCCIVRRIHQVCRVLRACNKTSNTNCTTCSCIKARVEDWVSFGVHSCTWSPIETAPRCFTTTVRPSISFTLSKSMQMTSRGLDTKSLKLFFTCFCNEQR